MTSPPFVQYPGPGASRGSSSYLVELIGEEEGRSFEFYDLLEIGRYDPGIDPAPGVLRIQDPTVSHRHCRIRLGPDGRLYLRDMSRNGIRIDGQRTVPNIEILVEFGQVISFGSELRFRLEGRPSPVPLSPAAPTVGTDVTTDVTVCTLVVGDIRNFTRLVQRTVSPVLQHSITRVFGILEDEVRRHGGTVKEYQGDAIVAFWELGPDGDGARDACRAALALDRASRAAAEDPGVWEVSDFPLGFDWALATGPVSFENVGGSNPTGLSMVGQPVVLSFRLEKLADAETGPILVCPATRKLAGEAFSFRVLGEKEIQGFNQPVVVHSLEGEAEPRRDSS